MITFTLPFHLHSINALLRTHWARRPTKSERQGARIVARAYGVRPIGPESVTVRIVRRAPRDLDDDNLRGAAKAVRDGIADALGVDDRDPRVTWVYDQARGKPSSVVVEIA